MTHPRWTGVFPAVTSKFTANEALDTDAMEKHFAFLIDNGVHGLVTGGSLGEASTMNAAERLEVLRCALRAADGRIPVLANVSDTRTKDACDFVEQAAAAGAQGFMVMPSVIYVADAREACDNVRTIAQAGGLPVMVYNNPIAYKVDLGPEDFLSLADCELVVAIKESCGDIRRLTDLRNALGDRYQLFLGVDDLAYEGLALGADGLLAGLVTAFPRETVALWNLAQQGNWKEALKLYQWFTPLLHLDVSTKLVQNIKLVEAMVGVGNEYVRLPRQPLQGAERERAERIVRRGLETRPDVSAWV